jgi:hypothetical protein
LPKNDSTGIEKSQATAAYAEYFEEGFEEHAEEKSNKHFVCFRIRAEKSSHVHIQIFLRMCEYLGPHGFNSTRYPLYSLGRLF